MKGFLQILTDKRGSRSSHIFVFFYQNAITVTKQVKPLTLMVSTKSAHLHPDNSLEAFNGFYLYLETSQVSMEALYLKISCYFYGAKYKMIYSCAVIIRLSPPSLSNKPPPSEGEFFDKPPVE